MCIRDRDYTPPSFFDSARTWERQVRLSWKDGGALDIKTCELSHDESLSDDQERRSNNESPISFLNLIDERGARNQQKKRMIETTTRSKTKSKRMGQECHLHYIPRPRAREETKWSDVDANKLEWNPDDMGIFPMFVAQVDVIGNEEHRSVSTTNR